MERDILNYAGKKEERESPLTFSVTELVPEALDLYLQ